MNDTFTLPTLEPGTYEHYKGNQYQVLGVGCHTETQEYYVIYQPLYEHLGKPDFWVRPYEMFIESVIIEGKAQPRFKKINESGQNENNSSDSTL